MVAKEVEQNRVKKITAVLAVEKELSIDVYAYWLNICQHTAPFARVTRHYLL